MPDQDLGENKLNLPVLSYSKVTSFKQCPKKYKFAYIDKLPRVDKPYTVFGNFCHYALQRFHERFLDTQKPSTYKEAMILSFRESIEKYKEKLTKEQIDEGYGIMKLYLSQIIDLGKQNKFPNVLNVEKKIWKTIDDFIFYGFIDRVQKDEDGLFHIIDYKTTKDKRFLKDASQILLYGYFIHQDNPEIKRVRTSYVLLKHKMQYMTHEHDVSELIEAKDKFVGLWQELKKEKLFRANPGFQNCTICDYTDVCEEGGQLMQRKKSFYGEETSW